MYFNSKLTLLRFRNERLNFYNECILLNCLLSVLALIQKCSFSFCPTSLKYQFYGVANGFTSLSMKRPKIFVMINYATVACQFSKKNGTDVMTACQFS